MAHENKSILEFIDEIKKGDYVIPHLQRDFEWKPNMVADLFKSILQDYYAGTVLLWALSDKERELEMWDPLWGAEKIQKPTKAILDGQQRLSSVFYALCDPKKLFPNRTTFYYFYINLDETFAGNEDKSITYFYQKKYKDIDALKKEKKKLIEQGLFSLCLLSDKNFLRSQEYQDWISEYVEKKKGEGKLDTNITALTVSEKIKSILTYCFLTETLEKKELKEICTIFANINSKGLRLSIFDLMNAFLYPHGVKIRKEWEKLDNEKLKEIDSNMKVYLLKLMSLVKQKYCSSRYLYNLIPGQKIKDREGKERVLIKEPTEFMGLWRDAVKYLEKARKRIMNSGQDDFGAIKNIFIPNTTLIPVLGALELHYDFALKDKVQEEEFYKKIKKWYWCAVLSRDYSGSSDSVMAKDFSDMQNWLLNDSQIPERVKKITSSFIDESIDFLKIKNTNNSQYSAILNLLALNLAKDFYTGRPVNSGDFSLDKIHDHHIFPKKCKLQINSDKVDSILNRTLLYDETNEDISNKKPSEYYEIMLKKLGSVEKVKEVMESHLIFPKALEFFKNDDFQNFIREREKTFKLELKKIIGVNET